MSPHAWIRVCTRIRRKPFNPEWRVTILKYRLANVCGVCTLSYVQGLHLKGTTRAASQSGIRLCLFDRDWPIETLPRGVSYEHQMNLFNSFIFSTLCIRFSSFVTFFLQESFAYTKHRNVMTLQTVVFKFALSFCDGWTSRSESFVSWEFNIPRGLMQWN